MTDPTKGHPSVRDAPGSRVHWPLRDLGERSPLAGVWAIGTLAVAFLVIGLVMLKGGFGKLTAYVGIGAGILGFAAVAGMNKAIILNAVAATVWLFLVGCRLCRLSR